MQRETNYRYLEADLWLDSHVLMNASVETDSMVEDRVYADWVGSLNSRQKEFDIPSDAIPSNAIAADQWFEEPIAIINDKLYPWSH